MSFKKLLRPYWNVVTAVFLVHFPQYFVRQPITAAGLLFIVACLDGALTSIGAPDLFFTESRSTQAMVGIAITSLFLFCGVLSLAVVLGYTKSASLKNREKLLRRLNSLSAEEKESSLIKFNQIFTYCGAFSLMILLSYFAIKALVKSIDTLSNPVSWLPFVIAFVSIILTHKCGLAGQKIKDAVVEFFKNPQQRNEFLLVLLIGATLLAFAYVRLSLAIFLVIGWLLIKLWMNRVDRCATDNDVPEPSVGELKSTAETAGVDSLKFSELRKDYTRAILIVAAFSGTALILCSMVSANAAISMAVLIASIVTVFAIISCYLRYAYVAGALIGLTLLIIGGIPEYKIRVKDLEGAYEYSLSEEIDRQPLLPRENLIQPESVAWESNRQMGKRPMIIVCASGGGIAAAAWSAAALCKLESEIDEFPYHVRMVCGASGGMVGASYYVASLTPPERGNSGKDEDYLIGQSYHRHGMRLIAHDDLVSNISNDSLGLPLKTLVSIDLPRLFVPISYSDHRGERLQSRWEESTEGLLATELTTLSQGEKDGWRPSLIFSPTLTDGRQLLISNLDLKAMIENNEEMTQLEYELGMFTEKMRVSTAARLSAAFPYVSPSSIIPLIEEHALDAGYFDNHGLNVTSAFLSEYKDWISNNASRVLVLRLVTFDSAEKPQSRDLFDRAFEEIATPPKTGFSVLGRGALGSQFEEDLQRVQAEYFDQGLPPIKVVTMKCPLQTLPLSWSLSEKDVEEVKKALELPVVREAVSDVKGWLSDNSDTRWRSDNSLDEILQRGALRVGFSSENFYGYYRWEDKQGNLKGFEPWLADFLCKKLFENDMDSDSSKKLRAMTQSGRIELIPVKKDWHSLLRAYTNASDRPDVDLIISTVSFVPFRSDRYNFAFSVPYGYTELGIFSRHETIHTIGGRVSIGCQKNTTSETAAKLISMSLYRNYAIESQIDYFSDTDEGLQEYSRRKDSNWIMLGDLPDLNSFLEIYGEDESGFSGWGSPAAASSVNEFFGDGTILREIPPHLRRQSYCIVANQDSPQLLRRVNEILCEYTESIAAGRRNAIYEFSGERVDEFDGGSAESPR